LLSSRQGSEKIIMNKSMRPGGHRDSKVGVKATTDKLVADLKAIRAQVASTRTPQSSSEQLEELQQRLFEVWVAEQLALAACRQEQAIAGMETAREESAQARAALAEARKELAELRKEVVRLGKVTDKLTAKLESIKTARAGKGR
jgi:chromosome segregation ATPase